MAKNRFINTKFWSDGWVVELDPLERYLYLYLLTNERTKQCGIYEISKRQMSFDMGCSIDTVSILIKYFIKTGKIQYSDSTNEIAIKNWKKFNYSTSPKVLKCIDTELKLIKNKVLIEYINSIDALSQEEEEQEEEQEEEKEQEEEQEESLPKRETHKIDFQEIINIFNSVCSELPKVEKISEKRKKLIEARIKENSLETLGIVFKKISESDFLSGRKTDFVASFDWVMNPANFLKILEDNYKNRKNGGDKSTEQVFADAMQSPLAKIDFFK